MASSESAWLREAKWKQMRRYQLSGLNTARDRHGDSLFTSSTPSSPNCDTNNPLISPSHNPLTSLSNFLKSIAIIVDTFRILFSAAADAGSDAGSPVGNVGALGFGVDRARDKEFLPLAGALLPPPPI